MKTRDKIKNSEIFDYIYNVREFRANSAEARIDRETEDYIVYSYDTEILRVSADGDVKYFDEKFYSKTTSTLQNIIRKVIKIFDDDEAKAAQYFD